MEGINTREDAKKLLGKLVYTRKDSLPYPSTDEFYYFELIGLNVKNTNNILVGKVKNVDDFGGGVFLELTTKFDKKSRLIPFTKKAFPKINIRRKFLIWNDTN